MVELRYFGGLSVEETAEVLKVSEQTVTRDWRMAKLWLGRELGRGHVTRLAVTGHDRRPLGQRSSACASRRSSGTRASRSAFLDEACAGDLDLRREVESLLGSQSAADVPVRGAGHRGRGDGTGAGR